jgi:protease-4
VKNRARLTSTGAFGAALLCWLVPNAVRADPLPTSAEHVETPGRGAASDDTTEALVSSPANLAWLPAPELRWTWVRCPDEAVKVGCGHAWSAGTPLPFGLSTALRVDFVQPPWGASETDGVGFPYRGNDYFWVTWGLATKLGENAAFGVSLERSYSQNAFVDGLFGVSASLSVRPDPHFGFTAVAHDFNRPSLTPEPSVSGPSLPVLDGRYTMAIAFRPTGRRNIDLGFEMQYWQGSDQWIPRVTLGVDIPTVGRVFGSAEAAHLWSDQQGIVGTAGLELHFQGLSAGGGALFGDGLGSSGTAAEYVTAAISGYTQSGIPAPAHAVWIRLEETPSTRGHVALLRRLWRLAREPDIDAVTLVVRAEPASSFAHAEEVADAIRVLKASGKKVLCSLENAGAKALYTCASADRIVLSPAGGIHYAGLAAQYVYLKGLLDKVGVQADFVRIGPHKTAPEEFTNEHAGPVAHEDYLDVLRNQEAVFVRNLSLYRHMSEDRVRQLSAQGPFVASEARDAGLVDSFAFDDELERATRELVGRNVEYEKDQAETAAPSTFGTRGKIALLYLDGDIIDGRSKQIPLLDMRMVGSYSMADTIRDLREDGSVRAVVLRIESPGGSSLASDVMWRELTLLAKRKPLIVSMGTVAASGGYYVASASRDIYALPLTITGSIGVFYGKADLSGLLAKIGVTTDTYKTTPRADAESLFRGFTPDEQHELEHKVQQFYDTFLDRVSEGRGMAKADIDAVGRGRVWMGQEAIEKHLIDHLGGLREAIDAARQAAHLPDDAPIDEQPHENRTLVQWALDSVGVSVDERVESAVAQLPPAIANIARALAPLAIYRGDEPLARMEYVDIGDQ